MELAEARALVTDKTDKDITVRHLNLGGGVMRALARRFGEARTAGRSRGSSTTSTQDQTGEDSARHAYLAAEWLREAGVVEPVVNAVLAHAHEQYRTDLMSKAVVHADAIAGLVAAALVRPERSESARRESEELEQRAKQERDALEQNILQRLDEAGATLDKANRIAEEALRKAEIQK